MVAVGMVAVGSSMVVVGMVMVGIAMVVVGTVWLGRVGLSNSDEPKDSVAPLGTLIVWVTAVGRVTGFSEVEKAAGELDVNVAVGWDPSIGMVG